MSLKLHSPPDKKDIEKLVFNIFRNLLVVYLILQIFNYLVPGYIWFYFNLDHLLYLLIGLGAASLIFYAEALAESDKIRFERINKRVSYAFLGLLLVVAVQPIAAMPLLEWAGTHLMIATVALGAGTFYLNRDELDGIAEEARQERLKEERRRMGFAEKYPRINEVWELRLIVRWMYKEGWWYGCSVIILLIVGFYIRVYQLGDLSLWWDEMITGSMVRRILEVGVPLQPSGIQYYWRGVAYHYSVALSAYMFGLTEFAIRLPSVLFGMGIVVSSFLMGKKLNKWVGLLILIFMVFSTYNIEYSRFARFYIMNAFLFMLSIFTVYKGFFEDEFKYKIISLIIFFIMIHTVQLAGLFMFVLGTYFFYESLRFVFSRNRYKIALNNRINFLFLVISISMAYFDNLFIRFFSVDIIHAYKILDGIPEPMPYPIVKIPEWCLFKFMDGNYMSITFIFLSLIILIIALCKEIKNEKNISYLSYVSFIFFISVLGFEILDRNVEGPRIYLFSEGLYVILSIFAIFFALRSVLKREDIIRALSLLYILVLISSIQPYFFDRINITYGDDVANDPFRTTHVVAYRADCKTQYSYLNDHIKEGDIWINVMETPYFYINKTPDYILNQNYRWNTLALLDEEGNFRTEEGESILINRASDIKNIIENNPDKKVWLVVNGGSVNILSTIHVRPDFLKFLKENEDKSVYQSPDKYSMVLLFT